MDINGKLDVQFFNLGYDRSDVDGNTEAGEYRRVDRCWNIYFHGFMDQFDDIAYVKVTTAIEPGIYEVVTYGIPAILFLWKYTDDHHRDLKGLLVKADDAVRLKNAHVKYTMKKEFI